MKTDITYECTDDGDEDDDGDFIMHLYTDAAERFVAEANAKLDPYDRVEVSPRGRDYVASFIVDEDMVGWWIDQAKQAGLKIERSSPVEEAQWAMEQAKRKP